MTSAPAGSGGVEPSQRAAGRRDKVRAALEQGVNRALAIQQPAIDRLARHVGHGDPQVSPAQAVAALERHYHGTVVGLGAAAGASSFVPGIGTAAGVLINVGEVGAYLEATALFCMALAEVHGVEIHDLDRRRLLLFAVLLGDAGADAIKKASERVGKHWAKKIVTAIPRSTLDQLNKVLGPNFVTKYGTKQSVLVLGREIPFGIGAGVGGAGNYLLARATIKSARGAFGPPPKTWPAPPSADHAPRGAA